MKLSSPVPFLDCSLVVVVGLKTWVEHLHFLAVIAALACWLLIREWVSWPLIREWVSWLTRDLTGVVHLIVAQFQLQIRVGVILHCRSIPA